MNFTEIENKQLFDALQYLLNGDIVNAIRETRGWFSPDRNNPVFILHDKLNNFFFDKAFQKLPIKYRIKLISKLSHKRHFTEGVSKSFALEYYYLDRDAFEEDGMIRGLEGGSINMTTEMKAYYHSIDETVLEIADNKYLLKDLVYEVAKPLSKVFYERLELISNELGLDDEVKNNIHVAAPIQYVEYEFKQAVVKCFEPNNIAFGMKIHGVRDSLKPINEYISDIKMFIDAYKHRFGKKDDDAQKTTETKQEIKNNSIEVIVTDIKWDVDHDSDSENLPKEVLYTFDRNEFDCIDDELQNEIEDIVSEKLSDDYRYCHDGFSVTIK